MAAVPQLRPGLIIVENVAALKDAVRDCQPFDETTGLPAQPGRPTAPVSWYDHPARTRR
jgi:hypothetical protein